MKKTRTKSARIREVAHDLAASGKPPRLKDIMKILAQEGVRVLSSQVSTALRGTGLMLKELSGPWEIPVTTSSPLEAIKKVSLDQLTAAREFVRRTGGQDIAIASIVALGCLKKDESAEEDEYYGGA
jgi:hypothetical protein